MVDVETIQIRPLVNCDSREQTRQESIRIRNSRGYSDTRNICMTMYCIGLLIYMQGNVSFRCSRCQVPHGKCRMMPGRACHDSIYVKQKKRCTYWLIRRTSTVLRSNSSKKGSAEKPSFAGCIPASSYRSKGDQYLRVHSLSQLRLTITVLPLYCTMWQLRPTSLPPPRQ